MEEAAADALLAKLQERIRAIRTGDPCRRENWMGPVINAAAADSYARAYYANNTVVGGILEYPRTLDEKSYTRLKNDWVEKRSGPGNAGWSTRSS